MVDVKSVARVQKKSTTTKWMLMRRRSSNFQAHHSQSSCDPLRSIFFRCIFCFFCFLARAKDFAEEEGRLLTVYVHSKMRNKVNFMHAGLFQISKIHS